MKSLSYVAAGMLVLLVTAELSAQIFVPNSGGRGYGIAIQFRSRNIAITGYFGRSYPRGYFAEPYGRGYYGPPPGVLETRVARKVYLPPPEYPRLPPAVQDVTGEDLDKKFPRVRLGPDGREIPLDQNGAPLEIPGKKVSKSKKPLRPGDLPKFKQPPKQKQTPKGPPKVPQPPKKKPLPLTPKEKAEVEINAGHQAFRSMNFGLAKLHYQNAVSFAPAQAGAYFWQAQAEFALGHYRRAADSIRAGMKRDPDWPRFKINPRTYLYGKMTNAFDAHLARLDKVIVQNPQSADFLFLSAHQRWFTGRPAAARKLFLRARDLTKNTALIDRFLNSGQPKLIARK